MVYGKTIIYGSIEKGDYNIILETINSRNDLNHIISMFDIYFKNKFDNRVNMELNNQYNSNSQAIDSQLSITINLK